MNCTPRYRSTAFVLWYSSQPIKKIGYYVGVLNNRIILIFNKSFERHFNCFSSKCVPLEMSVNFVRGKSISAMNDHEWVNSQLTLLWVIKWKFYSTNHHQLYRFYAQFRPSKTITWRLQRSGITFVNLFIAIHSISHPTSWPTSLKTGCIVYICSRLRKTR